MIFDLLPQGWALAKTSEAIEANGIIADGDWIESKDQDQNVDVRLIQLADIGDGSFRNKSNRFMTSENAVRMNCKFLESGDVLIARMPDPLGRACIFPGFGQNAVTVVDICLIRPNTGSAQQNKLLMYWINTPQVRNFIAMQATSTTRKRITRKKLEELELPIPSHRRTTTNRRQTGRTAVTGGHPQNPPRRHPQNSQTLPPIRSCRCGEWKVDGRLANKKQD